VSEVRKNEAGAQSAGAATFHERDFRQALGRFGTGVAIVTATVDGERLGATISSFNAVSLNPALVLFSLSRGSGRLAHWKRASACAISILGEHQHELANRFARSGGDKWADLPDRRDGNGAPLLPSCIGRLSCVPYSISDGGDHEIFVCRVTEFEIEPGTPQPLLFYAGRYRALRSEGAPAAPPDDNVWLHGW
jgi:flavin reductase (DIM6/NTAB) family NADH-FMN oxidoreductase RutF